VTPAQPARIHLLPAKEAPLVTIVRRKPSKVFHLLTWETKTDKLTAGSWFRGQLYPYRCDVSFDGKWFVYLALGSQGSTWNGLCRLPWLKTVREGTNVGTWNGGGYWARTNLLRLNRWKPASSRGARLPFTIETYDPSRGEDEGVLYARLERDGWRRAGPLGAMRPLPEKRKYTVVCDNDPGWYWRPTHHHPTLRAIYLGYLDHGHTFSFSLDEAPEVLDRTVQWATWDAMGQLVVTRRGGIERYSLAKLSRGEPDFQLSLEHLNPLSGRGHG
jgi:hypothetical protein